MDKRSMDKAKMIVEGLTDAEKEAIKELLGNDNIKTWAIICAVALFAIGVAIGHFLL